MRPNPTPLAVIMTLFITVFLGSTEPMMNNDLKERTAATIKTEYRQAIRTLAGEEDNRSSIRAEDRDRFAINCAHRLQGMAKLAISCGAADEARQALDAAKALRIAVYGGDGWDPDVRAGGKATIRAERGMVYEPVLIKGVRV